MIRAYFHPEFAAPIGRHIMPMSKFALVAERLRAADDVELRAPVGVTEADLLRVHSPEYVEAVRTGEPRPLAESQKLPWTPQLARSVLLTSGGLLAAARDALQVGAASALVSGFHHAHRDRGEGFCTFNGLVVTLEALRAEGVLRTAAILDLDLHYGNGTAKLAAERPWLRVLSLYGNDYQDNTAYRDVTVRRHEDGPNHRSVALPAGCDGGQLLRLLEEHLGFLLSPERPDLLLYQAGADPYWEDPYSPLALTHSDLLVRDRAVFHFARAHGLPIAWVLAGGYTEDVSKVVQVHVNTFQAWREIYGG